MKVVLGIHILECDAKKMGIIFQTANGLKEDEIESKVCYKNI